MNGGIEAAAFEPLHPVEQDQRFVARGPLLDCAGQQVAGALDVSGFVRIESAVQELLGLALPFAERAARPLDIGARTRVATVEKEDACPEVNRLLVAPREVLIEPGEQELLHARIVRPIRRDRTRLGNLERIGHQACSAIIGQVPGRVNAIGRGRGSRRHAL